MPFLWPEVLGAYVYGPERYIAEDYPLQESVELKISSVRIADRYKLVYASQSNYGK